MPSAPQNPSKSTHARQDSWVDLATPAELSPEPGLAAQFVVLLVGFRNHGDVSKCLRSLADSLPQPSFEVFIAENGGWVAMEALVSALDVVGSCCTRCTDGDLEVDSTVMVRRQLFQLIDRTGEVRARVHIAEMAENLGYAGGINAWLRPLLQVPGWEGAWILNPDTEVAPSALGELVAYSNINEKGMIGARLIGTNRLDVVHSRGLAWRKLHANTLAVDLHSQITPAPDPDDVQTRIDAPSGACCYVSRKLLEQIGLMDERYFLFFEDLEWGLRAKAVGALGYADAAVVMHDGGTTIGTTATPATMSSLAVYLEFRNRVLFVRHRFPAWLPWTIFVQLVHAGALAAEGAFGNMMTALRGLTAGVLGEVGRPDHILNGRERPGGTEGKPERALKLAISCAYFVGLRVRRVWARCLGQGQPQSLVVLTYHAVPASKREFFARQMKILARRTQVVRADWSGAPDLAQPAVAITFDDAFVSVVENALPELAERSFPCTIFVPSGVLGQQPNWFMETDAERSEVVVDAARLRQIDGPLVDIGAHSVTHPALTRIAPERARSEVRESRDTLANILGRPIRLFAFPYGDHDQKTDDLCREEGFVHAFTCTPELIDIRTDSLLRGRVCIGWHDWDLEFALKIAGAYGWMRLIPTIRRFPAAFRFQRRALESSVRV